MSDPNTSRPFSLSLISVTLTSHPFSFRSTLTPEALATIWCPKHTPITLTLPPVASALRVNSTSFTIHSSSRYAECLDPLMSTASMDCRSGYTSGWLTTS